MVEQLERALRAKGYRITPQRRAILQALAAGRTHPTAEMVFHTVRRQFPNLSRATVYKTMYALRDSGLIQEFEVEGRMRFDADVSSHAHFICLSCERVWDLVPGEAGAALQEEMERLHLHPLWSRVKVYGLCDDCFHTKSEGFGTAPA